MCAGNTLPGETYITVTPLRLWVVIFEKDCGVQKSQLVAADNCGRPRVLWMLGLHSAVGQEVPRESYARVCNLADYTISTSQRDYSLRYADV